MRFEASFVSSRPGAQCVKCRKRDLNKLVDTRVAFERTGPMRVTFTRSSGNAKTGPIPVSITTANSCPPTCGLYGKGCYAEYGILRMHWRNVAQDGLTWPEFCEAVRELEADTLWRHNEAGDLPGLGVEIDAKQLRQLVVANAGRRGFTFTHKPVLPTKGVANGVIENNRLAIQKANDGGFVVNLSADSLEQADALADLEIGPVAVVLPSDAPDEASLTPAGRKVVVCPAQTSDLTCQDCQLCAKPHKAVVGFKAHGQMRYRVSELVQLRRSA